MDTDQKKQMGIAIEQFSEEESKRKQISEFDKREAREKKRYELKVLEAKEMLANGESLEVIRWHTGLPLEVLQRIETIQGEGDSLST